MIENRPWGSFEILLDESYTKVKKISVNCGGKLSLQYHNKRDEHWVIVSGSGILTRGDQQIIVNYGDEIFIPRLVKHTIENDKKEDLIFIEVQTGEYFGEDDIIRLEDRYNRK